MSSLIVNVADRANLARPDENGVRKVPGVGENVKVMDRARGTTRFLGDETAGPWVYYSERPAGDEIPLHKHRSNRTEFLIDGEIEWLEPGKDPVVYGAGTLSYVEAGTVYGYKVLRDARILIHFEEAPGVQFL